MPRSSETGQRLPSPTYAEIGSMVRLLDGEPVKRVRELMNTIFEQDVSCVPVLDWSDPEQWIDDRLTGELRVLARKIWLGSDNAINPRHLYAHVGFITRLRLLEAADGIYRLGERGRRFLAADDGILRELVALRSAKRGRVRADINSGGQHSGR